MSTTPQHWRDIQVAQPSIIDWRGHQHRFTQFWGVCRTVLYTYERGDARRSVQVYIGQRGLKRLGMLMIDLDGVDEFAATENDLDDPLREVFGVDTAVMLDGQSSSDWLQSLSDQALHHARIAIRRDKARRRPAA
jgi:hypothetical protein